MCNQQFYFYMKKKITKSEKKYQSLKPFWNEDRFNKSKKKN